MIKQFVLVGLVAGIISFGLFNENSPKKRSLISSANNIQEQVVQDNNNVTESSVLLNNPQALPIVQDFVPDSRERIIGLLSEEARNEGEVVQVLLNDNINENSVVWLEYDLYGVADYKSVCKSVNEQLSTGGCFVKKNEEWTRQREMVSAKTVRSGLNIIRFNIADNAKYNYRIKNVRLHVEDGVGGRGLVLNNSGTDFYAGRYGYVQGFATGAGSETAVVRVDGKTVQSNRGVFESVLENANRESCAPWSTTVEVEYADGEVIRKEVQFEKSTDCDFSFPLTQQSATTFRTFMPASTIELQHEGVKLVGPAYSINNATTISATTLRSQDMAPMDGGLVNVTGMGKGYRMLPHGSIFAQNMQIKIKYDTSLIPAGYTAEDVFTFYYDEYEGNWVALERDTVDVESGEIVSNTNHFTDFINGIIKAPDMPEVQAYTPTSIKDLKAANPLEGVQLISPPSANNMGTATTGLPIEVPAGRGGMQPNLSIQYSSGGGNGWMGLGWNINTPEISVETRWGVPRYDASFETESYLLNGEELTPQVQRSNYKQRGTGSEKQFYPRVEGEFNKIVRHGTNPTNYYWTVTDKSGTTYYYGSTIDSKFASPNGNIARWALCRIEDMNGNSVIYEYETKTWVEPGTIQDGGRQMYLKKITYTNTGATLNGKYWVDFVLEDIATVEREDIQVSFRNGFKEVTGHRLARVVVRSEWGEVSRYDMTYQTGEFGKTLLTDIDHHVGKSVLSTNKNYHFDYFGISSRDSYFHETPDTIAVPDANLKDGTMFGPPTAIGNSKSWDVGGELGAGIGLGSAVWSKKNSVNISYGRNQSWSKGLSSFMDINGDGLPDKVVRDGEDVSFYAMQLNSNGEIEFNDTLKAIETLNSIGKDRSHTNSFGVSLHAGISKELSVNIAGGYSRTKSISNAYFSDVNSDGLVDFIEDGAVYYCKLENGMPLFEKNLTNTIYLGDCDTIVWSNGIDPTMFEEEDDTLYEKPTDVVRVWIAPFDGDVKVSNEIVYGSSPNGNGSNTQEWVKYSVEYQNTFVIFDSIYTNSINWSTTTDSIMNVHKGDKIFFRLFENENINPNNVKWECIVEYLQEDSQLEDGNDKAIYSFISSKDYTVTNKSLFEVPYNGKIQVTGNITAPALSDTIWFQIQKNGNVIQENMFIDNNVINFTLDTVLEVVSLDQLSFLLMSNTQVGWSSISSSIEAIYDIPYGVPPVADSLDNSRITFNPYIEYSLFPNDIFPSKNNTFTEGKIYIQPKLEFSGPRTNDGTIVFAVKKEHDLLVKRQYTIPAGNTISFLFPELSFDILTGENVYFEYYTKDQWLAEMITEASVLEMDNGDSLIFDAGLHTVYPDSLLIFGNLNRGWGQFTYSPDSRTAPIDTALLYLANCSDLLEDALDNLSDTSTISSFDETNIETGIEDIGTLLEANGLVNPMDEVFGYMYLDMTDSKWKGTRGKCMVNKSMMSTESNIEEFVFDWTSIELADQTDPTNVYEDESLTEEDLTEIVYSPYPVEVPGVIVRAVNRISKTDSYSLSASVGPTFASVGLNGTISKTNQLSDFMDLNGDGFPDVISAEKIQYTTPYGDFEATARDISADDLEVVSRNNSIAMGPTVGTNFPVNQQKGSKYNTKATGGVGAGGTWGRSIQRRAFNDVNGDGLQDFIYKHESNGNTYVKMNSGYGFEDDILVATLDSSRKSRSECYSVNLSAGYQWLNDAVTKEEWECSISLGVAFTFSDDGTKYFMSDVNSDGLPDRIKVDNVDKKMFVRINTGVQFAPEVEMIDFGSKFKENRSDNQGANITATFGFPIMGIAKLIISPSLSGSKSSSSTKAQLMDVNNDGFADVVFSDKEDEMIVYYSTLGKVNMLHKVTNPSDGQFLLDYAISDCSQDAPQRSMTMASVSIYDAHIGDGAHMMKTTFEYSDAVYDRENRTSYGFGTVITKQNYIQCTANCVYRVVTEKYHTDDYRFKGLKKYEEVADANGNKYMSTVYTYVLKYIDNGTVADTNGGPYCGDVYPAIWYENKYFFEGQPSFSIHTQKKYTHTSNGNISKFEDYGDVSDNNDNVMAEIFYADAQALIDNHILSLADSVNVYTVVGSTNTLKRTRTAEYNNFGRVTYMSVLNGTNVSTTQYGYDAYGNINSAVLPTDANNENKTVALVYDSQAHTYPVSVTNESGFSSSATYDYRIGKPLSTTDIAGQNMIFTYDIDGRMTSVRGPNEIANNVSYTIKFEYPLPGATIHNWAITRHYNPGYTDDIYTVQFVDGLGRPIQTKKTATIYNPSTCLDEQKTVISGKVIYDEFGRADSVWYPTVENYNLSTITTFSTLVDNQPPTLSSYDVMDRTVAVTTPDNKTTSITYDFGTDKYGMTRFKTTVTDANNVVSSVFKDPRDLQTTSKDALNGQTGFIYDAMGQLIESSDPENYATTYIYDMQGQLTQRTHPDAGTTKYYYDNAGNLTKMQTQNLVTGGDTIKYIYDLGKLVEISYPDNPEMNVYYEYGAPNTGNQSGRLVKQQDASGVQTFVYGRMGEMTENARTYVMPGGNNYTFKMLWQYDSWNRVKQITYPDGESVMYSYNQGGDLKQVKCAKPATSAVSNIVSAIGYDKFGSRAMMQYGNGTKTQYSYDPLNRRLSNLSSQNINNEAMQNIAYTYDNVGNITQTANSAASMNNGLGGAYTYNYSYDNLYRLTSSDGGWKKTGSYTLNMTYSASGRILTKTQDAYKSINGSMMAVPTYFTYSYNSTNKPHAVRSVGTGTSMEYDGNGNMTYYNNPIVFNVSARNQAWDEENRLAAVGDGSFLSSYVYDAGGDRVLKMSGARQQMLIGGQQYINFANLNENKTLYVGAYMVVKNTQYTKHYYIEGERVSTKIGGGFLYAPIGYSQSITPLLNGASYLVLGQQMLHHLKRDAQAVGFDSTQTTFPTLFRCIGTMSGSNTTETEKFYYHSDHLGSSSFISDKNGLACQHLQYLPFGETFVDQRATTTFNSRYTFSAKEKDDETQYSYFGARYYDSDLSVWLSVDPMSDKYPSTSPYMYVMGNPLILVDPNGMSAVGPDNYTIYEDSKTVTKQTTTDNTNTYTYVKSDGTKVDLGTYDKVTNDKGEDMVQAANSPDGSNSMYKWVDITSKNWYFPEDGFALILGGIQDFYEKNGGGVSKVQFNQFMSLNGGKHTRASNWPPSIDVAFYFIGGTTGARTSSPNISLDLNLSLLNSLKGFGVGVNSNGAFEGEIGSRGYHIYSWSNETRSAFFKGTQGCPEHHHHFHFENYDQTRIRTLYPLSIPR